MKNLLKKELESRAVRAEGGLERAVVQLGPHEPLLRAYRYDNMSLVINADCAVWYFTDRTVSIEDMVLNAECETVSYWFGTDDELELTLVEFINGMVHSLDTANYIANDEYYLKGECDRLVIDLKDEQIIAYRYDNMSLVLTENGFATWYPLKRTMSLKDVLEGTAPSPGCITEWQLPCKESEGREKLIRLYVTDEETVESMKIGSYIARKATAQNLAKLATKLDEVISNAFAEMKQNKVVSKSIENVNIIVRIGSELYELPINADTVDNMRALAFCEANIESEVQK